MLVILAVLCTVADCRKGEETRRIVIYTSVDQVYSEPILKTFEEVSGIRVLAVFDVEATKTTGLVNRLIAEKDRPQADVFWNGEFAQTLLLKEVGVLAPYRSENASGIPDIYKDPEGYWTGLAGRARVILVNTSLVPSERYPSSIYDFLDPSWPAESTAIAYPMFGTTATHAAALYAMWGPSDGKAYFEALKERGVRIVDGNAAVRDMVVDGRLMMGLTDTDDACRAVERGTSVEVVFPDQDALGTMFIPNTVALISGSPHPEEARQFIEYLLSTDVAEEMVQQGWSHIPLHSLDVRPTCYEGTDIHRMDVSLSDVYRYITQAKEELGEIFIR